ncbi:MAG: hypothetical protein ACKVE4_00920 [Dissulfuribacterales bacterium]
MDNIEIILQRLKKNEKIHRKFHRLALIPYDNLIGKVGKSRVMLNLLINIAIEKDYIAKSRRGFITIQDKGKFYAIEHKLVDV